MLTPEMHMLLQEILEEWNKSEKSIKLAEQIDDQIVNPSIYELRYAGRRIVEACSISGENEEKALQLLHDAKFDCHRARHDAIDAMTSKMIGTLTAAEKHLGSENILPNFAKYPDLLNRLNNVRMKIAISREDRENRDAIYDVVETADLQFLEEPAQKDECALELYNQFRASEPLMKAAVKRQTKVEKRNFLIAVAGVAIGIAGLAIGFFSN